MDQLRRSARNQKASNSEIPNNDDVSIRPAIKRKREINRKNLNKKIVCFETGDVDSLEENNFPLNFASKPNDRDTQQNIDSVKESNRQIQKSTVKLRQSARNVHCNDSGEEKNTQQNKDSAKGTNGQNQNKTVKLRRKTRKVYCNDKENNSLQNVALKTNGHDKQQNKDSAIETNGQIEKETVKLRRSARNVHCNDKENNFPLNFASKPNDRDTQQNIDSVKESNRQIQKSTVKLRQSARNVHCNDSGEEKNTQQNKDSAKGTNGQNQNKTVKSRRKAKNVYCNDKENNSLQNIASKTNVRDTQQNKDSAIETNGQIEKKTAKLRRSARNVYCNDKENISLGEKEGNNIQSSKRKRNAKNNLLQKISRQAPEKEYLIGEIVLGTVSGFAAWPARIISLAGETIHVEFFGTGEINPLRSQAVQRFELNRTIPLLERRGYKKAMQELEIALGIPNELSLFR